MDRRRFLTAAATGTAVGLAGCGEPDDDDNDDDGGGGYAFDTPTHKDPPSSVGPE